MLRKNQLHKYQHRAVKHILDIPKSALTNGQGYSTILEKDIV